MEGHIPYLYADCWQFIFSRLGIDDLKAVTLCCKDFLKHSNLLKERLKVIHPEISMLSRHLNRFKRLKYIDLSSFEGDIDEAIREIKRSGISSTLEALNIAIDRLFEGSTDESVRLRLRGLAPKFRNPTDDSTLQVIANTFPNLEQLSLHLYDHNPMGFMCKCPKFKLLKKIHLYGCNVCDKFIIALSLNCVLIEDVAIGGSHLVTETGVGHLLRNRPNLKALSLTHIEPDEHSSINIENSIGHNQALTSLHLCRMRNTDKVLKVIAKAKLGLNNLSLIACRELTVPWLLVVMLNHQLTKLRLIGYDFRDEHIKLLVSNGNVSSLTHLEINLSKVKGSTLFLLSTRCPSLVDITMGAANLNEQVELDILPVPKNHKITSLRLELSRFGISDEFLKQLGLLFPNLKVLHLSKICSSYMHIGIGAILKSCKQITELNLALYDNAKLFGANHDSELGELNLEVLTLQGSGINDEGVVAIAKKCPRLLSLDLSHCSYITTEGIKQVVQNIKTLTSLNLMHFDDKKKNYGALLEWMLSTRNLASLHKIFLQKRNFTKKQRDRFLLHGCLLSSI